MISPAIAYTRLKLSFSLTPAQMGSIGLLGAAGVGAGYFLHRANQNKMKSRDVDMAENLQEGSGEGSGAGSWITGPDGKEHWQPSPLRN
jgi:hypothetical protein